MVSNSRWRTTLAIVLFSVLHYLPRLACEERPHQLLSESNTSISTLQRHQTTIPEDVDVSECIVLFAAFCNGNMGDVAQAASMRHLIDGLTEVEHCVWYAHPVKEDPANGFSEGEFFGGDISHLLGVGCNSESAAQVSRFKGLIVGGGGLLESRHQPLDCLDFIAALSEDLPVAIFAVGASEEAGYSDALVARADYISGRDEKSVVALSELLETLEKPRVKPNKVRTVRDAVLSDNYYTDVKDNCWNRGPEAKKKPLCFVLPSAQKEVLRTLHRVYASQIVKEGDILLNVFPKHQAEIEAYNYTVPIEIVLDPLRFIRRLCDCRTVVSSRLHGAIFGLHSGVPTIGAWPIGEGNKVPGLMKEVMQFSDQFLLVNESLTRRAVEDVATSIRVQYGKFGAGRRKTIFSRLQKIHRRARGEAHRVLSDLFHLDLPEPSADGDNSGRGGFWMEENECEPEAERPSVSSGWVSEGGKGEQITQEKDPKGGGSPSVRVDEFAGKEFFEQPGQIEGGGSRSAAVGALGSANAGHTREGEIEFESLGDERGHQQVNTKTVQNVNFTYSQGNFEPGERLKGEESTRQSPASPREQVSFGGSLLVTLAALVLTGLLCLPMLSSPSKGEGDQQDTSVWRCPPTTALGSGGRPLANTQQRQRLFSPLPGAPRMMFFGVNYFLWILLSVGFNLCSKTYLRETGNPVALLAMQGWAGVVILVTSNAVASWRRPLALASPSSAISPTAHEWAGRCGLREAKGVGKNVWQAALLHSGNAVLTSWSVLVGGIAATHALKALEPVAAAGFSRWLLGSTVPPRRIGAMGVIIVGLGILMLPNDLRTWARASKGEGGSGTHRQSVVDTELELVMPAVITACACCAVALRNVLLKGTSLPRPPSPPLALLVCSIVAAGIGSMGILLPWMPFYWQWSRNSLLLPSGVNASLCFVGYNLASFNLLSQLSPVGHAVGNASKRVCLFGTGLIVGEDGSLSARQLAGASVAFVGLASYNLAGVASLQP